MKGKLFIGTSGWHYDHWSGTFYPKDVPKKEFLAYYAGLFKSAEINNSFYQLPAESTLASWRDTVPKDFTFAVKASRYITHMKKMKDPSKSTPKLFERIEALGGKLGPVLFQLPPRFRFNRERLASFLGSLPQGRRYAFEFRDFSWENDEAYEVLENHGAAWCIYHLEGRESKSKVTADFVYIRLHGPGGAYQGKYKPQTLSRWARHFEQWRKQGLDVYCFFDNDENGYAAQNAYALQEKTIKKEEGK